MKVMITGASGFLGRAVYRTLQPTYRVAAFGHAHTYEEVRPLDLRDVRALRMELEEGRPDVVVHCAAYRDPDFCEQQQEETTRLNVTPLRTMADVLPDTARMVFVSTDYVFDGEQPPYAETDKRRPINFYGQSKMEAEDIVRERTHSVIVRVPLLMGTGATFPDSGFVAQMVEAVELGEPVVLDHRTMRYPTDIEDVAALIAFLLAGDYAGVFHWSGPEGKTQYEWALTVAEWLGRSASHIAPAQDGVARRALRPANSHLATDYVRGLGFDRQTSFADVLSRVCALRDQDEVVA